MPFSFQSECQLLVLYILRTFLIGIISNQNLQQTSPGRVSKILKMQNFPRFTQPQQSTNYCKFYNFIQSILDLPAIPRKWLLKKYSPSEHQDHQDSERGVSGAYYRLSWNNARPSSSPTAAVPLLKFSLHLFSKQLQPPARNFKQHSLTLSSSSSPHPETAPRATSAHIHINGSITGTWRSITNDKI